MRRAFTVGPLGLLLVLIFAGAGSLHAMARRPAQAVHLPVEANHPYADAFQILDGLTDKERETLLNPTPDQPAGSPAMAEIAAALGEGRATPPRWLADHDPLSPDYDSGFMGDMSALAAIRFADAARRGDSATGDAAVVDVLAFLQSVGPGLSSDEWSRQQELIGDALRRLQGDDAGRSPAEAAALAAALRALPPPTSFLEMIRADPMWAAPGEKLRKALEREARSLGLSPERIGPKSLRMSGFVIEPARAAVSLETPAGSFWLERGQTFDGVTLLDLDEKRRCARIRFDGRVATIELKSRRIERWDDAVLDRATKSLAEKSDFLVGAFLTRKGGTLSEHLERLDAFAREMSVVWAEFAEDPARLAEPGAQAECAKRLEALAPWEDFSGKDCVTSILDCHARGQAAQAAWRETLEMLDRQAGR